jgi:hypothetical protein
MQAKDVEVTVNIQHPNRNHLQEGSAEFARDMHTDWPKPHHHTPIT